MRIPLQITWRDIEPSPAVEAEIRRRAQKLEALYDNIMGCRVILEVPHGHHRQGNLFHIRIDLTVPGHEIVVKRGPAEHGAHEDVYVAIRDAFDASKRQLQDYVRRRRGQIKTHELPHHGRIISVFPAQDHGFIETPDKRQIYFHRNSLIDIDFDHLDPGVEVIFVEEQGKEGPQACRVMVGKHHVEV